MAALNVARVRANLAAVRGAHRPPRPRASGATRAQSRSSSRSSTSAPTSIETLADAGVTLVGENRAQDAAREGHAVAAGRLRWHFIGALQSRKVKPIVPHVELIHSVASESALRELGRHAPPGLEILVEVNVAGEPGKAGIAPGAARRFHRARAGRGRRADDDAAADGGPGAKPSAFRSAGARSRASAGSNTLSMGTSQDFEVAVEEGATIRADRHEAVPMSAIGR